MDKFSMAMGITLLNRAALSAMDKFSMAMGITLLNRAALSAMTLTQVAWESKSTTWSI
jgi:hypothetical protein